MSTRPADFDLAAALARKEFTPGARDAAALVAMVAAGAEPAATRAQPALAGLGEVARTAIERAWATLADDGARARMIAVIGLLARGGDAAARASLIARTGDASPRVRKAAAVALGKLGAARDADGGGDGGAGDALDDVRAALIARWDAPADGVPADERRALAEALGKLGGDEARARLAALDGGGDAELQRRRDRALLMADRSARRTAISTIADDAAPPAPVTVRLHCRGGLASVLCEELAACGFAAARRGDDAAEVTLDRGWAALFASRLWMTAGVRVPLVGVAPAARATVAAVDGDGSGAALGRAITATLASAGVRALLAAWTRGPIRWRLGFAHGHRRAVVWNVARDVAAAAPELLNDPHATTWDVIVDEPARMLELVPRRLEDPRFAWRAADIPAASHPTVAAALAWIAGARAGDRVWDPFVGSGAELIERARRGPCAALYGSDLADDALAAARANVVAAGVTATLAHADARTYSPGPVELVLSNPPLGGRLRGDAAALLCEALPHLTRQLVRGGRLVWITPAPRRTGPIAIAAGLLLARAYTVDLGGLRATLERWDKP